MSNDDNRIVLGPDDKVLVVGLKASNFTRGIRKHPKLIFWDATDNTIDRKTTIPLRVKCVVMYIRLVSHNIGNRIKSMLPEGVLFLNHFTGPGQVKDYLKSLGISDDEDINEEEVEEETSTTNTTVEKKSATVGDMYNKLIPKSMQIPASKNELNRFKIGEKIGLAGDMAVIDNIDKSLGSLGLSAVPNVVGVTTPSDQSEVLVNNLPLITRAANENKPEISKDSLVAPAGVLHATQPLIPDEIVQTLTEKVGMEEHVVPQNDVLHEIFRLANQAVGDPLKELPVLRNRVAELEAEVSKLTESALETYMQLQEQAKLKEEVLRLQGVEKQFQALQQQLSTLAPFIGKTSN
jgi:hypothetical protein